MVVPAVLATVIGPLVAPLGIFTLSCVSEVAQNVVAPVPLMFTPVVPVKFAPVIVTVQPAAPLAGEKLLIVGVPVEVGVKLLLLQSVVFGVFTLIQPVSAPPGTVAVICVSEFTVKLAGTRKKVTAVAPVKLVPVIVTVVPIVPLAGVNELMCGATVKLAADVAEPKELVSVIGPLVAPLGTLALNCVSEMAHIVVAGVPLKLTPVVPVKFVPVRVTVQPVDPLVGENELTVGIPAESTVNGVPLKLQPVPEGVVTLSEPVVAPPGTVAVIWVSESMLKLAAARLNATPVAPVKCAPVIVTVAPSDPLLGVNEVIAGGPGRRKPCSAPLASLNHPVIAPLALILCELVPRFDCVPAPGASKIVIAPSGARTKPCIAQLLLSRKLPVIVPLSFRLLGAVPQPPVPAP